MDWDTYKRLCDLPDYWSRWMLLRSAVLLEERGAHALGARVCEPLLGAGLPKPPGHRGPAATDMFCLHLTAQEARAVCQHIAAAHAEQRAHAEVVAWEEYARSRERQPDAC